MSDIGLLEVEELKHHIECPSSPSMTDYQSPDGKALTTFLHHQGLRIGSPIS
jgi:hypothetical protein